MNKELCIKLVIEISLFKRKFILIFVSVDWIKLAFRSSDGLTCEGYEGVAYMSEFIPEINKLFLVL